MIRYVLNYSNRIHLVAKDFNEVKWMSIDNRMKYLAASHVFNCIDEQAPEYLQVFERVNESHPFNTRHSVNASLLPKVGSYGIKSFHINYSPNVCIILYDIIVMSILSSEIDHYMRCHWTLGRLGPLWK